MHNKKKILSASLLVITTVIIIVRIIIPIPLFKQVMHMFYQNIKICHWC